MKQGEERAVYRLTMYCALGLDCHGKGIVIMNTHSLLLCFHPKPSFVMQDGNVISNPKISYL